MKDLTFASFWSLLLGLLCLCCLSLKLQRLSLCNFLCERVIFTVLSSLGSILFSTMISISSESIVLAKDVLLYLEHTISRNGGKNV